MNMFALITASTLTMFAYFAGQMQEREIDKVLGGKWTLELLPVADHRAHKLVRRNSGYRIALFDPDGQFMINLCKGTEEECRQAYPSMKVAFRVGLTLCYRKFQEHNRRTAAESKST